MHLPWTLESRPAFQIDSALWNWPSLQQLRLVGCQDAYVVGWPYAGPDQRLIHKVHRVAGGYREGRLERGSPVACTSSQGLITNSNNLNKFFTQSFSFFNCTFLILEHFLSSFQKFASFRVFFKENKNKPSDTKLAEDINVWIESFFFDVIVSLFAPKKITSSFPSLESRSSTIESGYKPWFKYKLNARLKKICDNVENVKKSCEKRTKYLQDVVTAAAEPPVKESGGDIDWDEVLEWWMGVRIGLQRI